MNHHLVGSESTSASPDNHSNPQALAPMPFGLVPLNDELALPQREFLVEGLWPERAVGFIAGPPKAGKSWLALDMSICLAAGIPFLGREVSGPKRVFYFLGEEYLGDVAERADKLLAGHGLSRADLQNRLAITQTVPRLEDSTHREELAIAVRDHRPDLIVLDPLERFLDEADTNSSRDVRSVNNFLRERLTRDLGAAVCVVHHTDKKGKSLRGTGDFRAVSEVTLTFGEKSGNDVRIACEMRCGRTPEPMRLRLSDGAPGVVNWEFADAAMTAALDSDIRIKRAKAFFEGGVARTQGEVQKHLGMKAKNVKPFLETLGASREGPRSPWTLDLGAREQAA